MATSECDFELAARIAHVESLLGIRKYNRRIRRSSSSTCKTILSQLLAW